ncbi:Clavaminate synthase-like protein [Obba rivulosa]|uniref:Clavaminate synthase-like protein n=1 Tax=Obba rivulosa TaxID=1052685 RepID=A0A8E2DM52_9APHY|nr:Clavaminate synthase-like protein [Obba rivulosa]
MNLDPRCDRLEEPPTYHQFLEQYLIPNRPVIIGPSLVSSWPAFRDWVNRDDGSIGSNSSINWDFLVREYGECEVTVADCSTRDFSDQKRETKLLREVIDLWRSGQGDPLYVKDWHLARTLHGKPARPSPGQRPFYSTPDIFRDDWMNAYYSACTADDFRFVYVGARGTFTPLHRDVYTSYSWSTNVCGRKRWWLFPPEQTRLLVRKGGEEHAEVAYDVRRVDAGEFPEIRHARPIVVEQDEGETIFVENLTACISINHNWCNAVNLPSLYSSMCAKVVEVERALDDVRELLAQNSTGDADDWVREWIHIVQDVVEKDAGWNWSTFWLMVLHALRITSASDAAASSDLWVPAPRELMPSIDFIRERIKQCLDDFVGRDRQEVHLVPGLGDTVASIRLLLEAD